MTNFIGGFIPAGQEKGRDSVVVATSSAHVVNDPKYLTNIRYFEEGEAPEFNTMAGTVYPTAIGDWELILGNKPYTLTDTLLMPGSLWNTISMGLLGSHFPFIARKEGMVDISDPENENVVAKPDPVNGAYYAIINGKHRN